jgi:DNA-binding XRE family transcriptional regulator
MEWETRDNARGSIRPRLLRDIRIERLMTQSEFASELGVALSSVVAWETGRSNPRLSMRRRIAEYLEMAPQEIRWEAPPRMRAKKAQQGERQIQRKRGA